MIEINWNPNARELRTFSAILIVFFALIALAIGHRTQAPTVGFVIFAVAAVVGTIGLIRPAAIRPVYFSLVFAGFPIGWVVSHVILLAIFFLVFTPIGFLVRRFVRDPMQRTMDRDAASYWETRQVQREPTDYFRQF